jgi:hypothetical protein
MTLNFIKQITKEGKRKVINVPKKYSEDFEYGEDVLVSKIDMDKIKDDNRKI